MANAPQDIEASTFKALADASRRTLLDALFQKDGQTLIELESYLDMSRFGVMKHLRILEEAGLITTEKVGREKHHYLNPVPIQLVYDRWVSKYAQPITNKLSELKYRLEKDMNTITHRYQIFIQASPEQVWKAVTDGDISPHYYFGTTVTSDWKVGSTYTYGSEQVKKMIEGEILEIDPPNKLVQTFQPLWEPDAQALSTSKVTWLFEESGEGCKLTLVHEELDDVPFANGIIEGWSRILSSLKTYLETGNSLRI